MEQAERELTAQQLATGKPLVQESRRMSVISLVFTLKSFIVRGFVRHLHCDDCAELLVSDTKGTLVLTLKDNGRLIEESAFVQAGLCEAERLAHQVTTTGHAEVEKLTLTSFQTFVSRHVTMLNNMNHYREEPHHVLDLTKVIQRKSPSSSNRHRVNTVRKQDAATTSSYEVFDMWPVDYAEPPPPFTITVDVCG
ncbi:hypothetical protein HPB51_020559 [Rhipicephalus microplus]|uniref:Uncharacterized protein n=1 Tax=Rhipicephalus microplus TaxID=6941 RepID=A0A9J6DX36_RHIMP|nr:hypothetical protein HPB51_020559 [Rhipicephalus microplus]